MEKKRLITRIAVAAGLFLLVKGADLFWHFPVPAALGLYMIPYLIAGWDVLWEAGENILRGKLFDERFLMSIATLGAMAVAFLPGGQPAFDEAVFVMLFYKVGELLEEIAEERSRRSVSHLMALKPETVQVEREGRITEVKPEEVIPGEIMVLRPGERIPLDGTVAEGTSLIDTAALTGESLPREAGEGEEVLSGSVNLTALLRVRAAKPYAESTVSRILEMMENAEEKKSHSEKLITRFARVYTPVVVGAALLLALLPPLFSGDFTGTLPVWLLRALTFLVVSCPCALVISVPLTYFSGIGGASKQGILFRSGADMDALSKAACAVFDKTGTLTEGRFSVSGTEAESMEEEDLLFLAAKAEQYSTHPAAVSVCRAYEERSGKPLEKHPQDKAEEIPGEGISAILDGRFVAAGNRRLMERFGIAVPERTLAEGTLVYVAVDGRYAGMLNLEDRIRPGTREALEKLSSDGIGRFVMLTGDRKESAERVAARLGIQEVHAQLLPEGKTECMEKIRADSDKGKTTLFVGDGINDAPILALSDVGIAMGGVGSDAAIEAAGVVLMNDDLGKVDTAIRAARRTRGIAAENILFALLVKAAALILAALGYAPMALAVFADVGVMFLCILNAMRALHTANPAGKTQETVHEPAAL